MTYGDYRPLQNGIPGHQTNGITYAESTTSEDLQSVLHCAWSLRSTEVLEKDFVYVIVPDACVDIVFDVLNATPPVIMTPHLKIFELNLGTNFHYVGARLKPGVFFEESLTTREIVGEMIEAERLGTHDLGERRSRVEQASTDQERYQHIENLVRDLVTSKIVEPNSLVQAVLGEMQSGTQIEVIADKLGYSSRQLRRKIASDTGFSPIQLRRVVRFQEVLSAGNLALRFADQSHLIKEFRRITGTSYQAFLATFE